jgi:hypothetical protein
VLLTVLHETRRPRARPRSRSGALAARAASTLGVYLTITVLWSMWSGESVGAWLDAVSYWR